MRSYWTPLIFVHPYIKFNGGPKFGGVRYYIFRHSCRDPNEQEDTRASHGELEAGRVLGGNKYSKCESRSNHRKRGRNNQKFTRKMFC